MHFKGFGNWNPGPEVGDLRLSEEPQFDMSIRLIAKSRTTNLSLLSKWAAILTGVLG